MKTIIRKTMLYKTGVEYGDYTMNHVSGCWHGCRFPCYAFLMAKRFGKVKTYEEWCEPKLVSNTLELLDKEIPRMKEQIKEVQLCFTTDPFMYGYDEIAEMSIAAIRRLNRDGIKCTILTKGILPIELAELDRINEYGITLVSLDEDFRRRFEPNTAGYAERIAALRALSERGCKTWISIEPYPTPNMIEQDLLAVLNAVAFTDRIVFGRLNYNAEVSAYRNHRDFYNQCVSVMKAFCNERQISYYIKNGTET